MASKEVAQIVGCRESTVRNHLFNARKTLRRELLERYPEYVRGRPRAAPEARDELPRLAVPGAPTPGRRAGDGPGWHAALRALSTAAGAASDAALGRRSDPPLPPPAGSRAAARRDRDDEARRSPHAPRRQPIERRVPARRAPGCAPRRWRRCCSARRHAPGAVGTVRLPAPAPAARRRPLSGRGPRSRRPSGARPRARADAAGRVPSIRPTARSSRWSTTRSRWCWCCRRVAGPPASRTPRWPTQMPRSPITTSASARCHRRAGRPAGARRRPGGRRAAGRRAAGKRPTRGSMRGVYAYTLKHQPAHEALALIRPLLTARRHGRGAAGGQHPGDPRAASRPSPASCRCWRSFDHPPEDLRFDIRIVRAGPSRQVISPPIEAAPADSELPEDLVTRLRELLRYDDYRVLAKAASPRGKARTSPTPSAATTASASAPAR